MSDTPPPSLAAAKGRPILCSFCAKGQNEVRKIVAGAVGMICDECVELIAGMMASEGIKLEGIVFTDATLSSAEQVPGESSRDEPCTCPVCAYLAGEGAREAIAKAIDRSGFMRTEGKRPKWMYPLWRRVALAKADAIIQLLSTVAVGGEG